MTKVYFPYGVSNFEELIRDGFIFVDKTAFIEKLEINKEKRVSFLRPRKFGKSLWLSILEYYYDTNQAHKFQQLFGKYYIGKNPTPLHNQYRILKFDFSGIDTETKEKAKRGFSISVQSSLNNFQIRYSILTKEASEHIFNAADAEQKIKYFFDYYPNDKPIYLLFDEYDHFTNDILYRSVEEFIDSVSKQGYVRKFYEVIKAATQQGVVDRVFITGVSPLTLDALTSGFNILTDLTHSPEFDTMLGFTENEVKELVRLTLQDPSREDEVLQEMREWYNGYKFSIHSRESIYNSDMVLYYLKAFSTTQKAPDNLLDINIAPDYHKLRQMFEVVNFEENKQVLREVLEKGYVTAPLISQFSFSHDFGSEELINFLAYLGNLTIEGVDVTGRIKFRIPNRVIEKLYWQYYGYVLTREAGVKSKVRKIDKAIEEMARSGSYEEFFRLIGEVLGGLSNRDFIEFSEKQIKMVLIAYLMLADIFEVVSEREVRQGYPDLMLLRKSSNVYEHHEFVIELKYLKKGQEGELDKVKAEARAQILRYYEQDKHLQNRPYLHLLTVVCVKDELYVERISTLN
ncbi:MAG: AAA family ATPase [Bacteroidia bacterium]|nr:AAA family ATPase [Bacteroidia bacterium]